MNDGLPGHTAPLTARREDPVMAAVDDVPSTPDTDQGVDLGGLLGQILGR